MFFFFTAVVLITVSGCEKPRQRVLVLENNTEISRTDEALTITRVEMERWFGDLPAGLTPVLISSAGDTIPAQVDDLTGNDIWDELFFLYTFDPLEDVQLTIEFVAPEDIPSFTRRRNIHFARITDEGEYEKVTYMDRPSIAPEDAIKTREFFQFEGPGWENDIVGFRNYFDERNGFDIFGKTTSEMVLQDVGIDEDYHELQDWGMDNLRVGSSLGAGNIALLENETLIRAAFPSNSYFEEVVDGPLRSIFRLVFDNWQVEGNSYDLVHEISIWGGAWFYEADVILTGIEEEKTMAAGITTIDLQEDRLEVDESFQDHVFIATHGRQGYMGEFLGMAIMADKDHYSGYGKAPETGADVVQSYYAEMPVRNNLPVTYRFYACWELTDENFQNREYFLDLLRSDAFRMDHPVIINPVD